jgi:hypothetical protein
MSDIVTNTNSNNNNNSDDILPMAVRFLSGTYNRKYGGSIKMSSNAQLSLLL